MLLYNLENFAVELDVPGTAFVNPDTRDSIYIAVHRTLSFGHILKQELCLISVNLEF